jgi:transposase
MKRARRAFTPEFKLQLVKLYENGKSRADIARGYNITPSALDRWIKNHKESGSFKAEDHRSTEEHELLRYWQCVKSYNYHVTRITITFAKKMIMKTSRQSRFRRAYLQNF